MRKKEVKLYNILLPIWILIFVPSWLWLILIPANYLIDRLVLHWSLGAMPDKGAVSVFRPVEAAVFVG